MPITYSLATPGLDIVVKITGEIRPEDIIGYMHDLMVDLDNFTGKRALIEVDGLKPKGFNFSSVNALSQQTKLFEPKLNGSRTAICAPSAIAYGLARMYLMIRNPPYAMSVFRERNDALDWLCLDPPP